MKRLACALLGFFGLGQMAAGAPNVIFVLVDDLGYSDVSCYGAKTVVTPNIDRLAAEGLKFTDFHTAASICSPSRAAFLTGAYPQRAGAYLGLNPNRKAHWFLGLNPEEVTLAEQFQVANYETFMVGKWHLGTEPEFLPQKQGFDHYYGMPCNFAHSPQFLDEEQEVFAQTPLDRLTELYTGRVKQIIRDQGAKPFFLYYAHNYPHTPFKAGKKFAGSSKGGARGDVIQELDWSLGEMMTALEETGVADNTLIIFTSDNGPTDNQFALPYRGTKYVTFEGGHRVPFILHWPKGIEGGRILDVPTNAMDLFPTLSEIIAAPMPTDRVYDGESLVKLFGGGALKRTSDEPFYYYNCENLQAVRQGDWKLHLPRTPEQLPFWDKNKAFAKLKGPVLYNLREDESETTDVASAHPEIVASLSETAASVRGKLGEFMQRGTEQRATGSVISNVPVISHEKDWETVDAATREAIAQERQMRHPETGKKAPKGRAKKVPKQGAAKVSVKMGAPRPNVVVIFADDLGYGDLSCYGATKLKTPNIDRLAAQGRKFTDAHSASAVCTPSRYALMTGEYPHRKNLSKPVFLRTGLVIDTNQQTVASVMKEAGYATACIGKWHLGFGEKAPDWNGDLKPGPLEVGFDYYYGVPVVNSHPPFVYVENHRVVGWVPDDPFVYGKKAKTQVIAEKLAINQIGGADAAHALYDDYAVGTRLTEKSVEWIESNKDKPFFLYLATTNIHHPFTPAKRFQGTSECGIYGDFVHELDWIVGEVVATLEKHGLADNTLVIFTSDNGGMINVTGQKAITQGHRLNGDLLGFKFDAWEGGHRVPFIVRWPGKVEAGSTSDQLICNVDMLATLAAMIEMPLADADGPDSFNLLPALIGSPELPIRDHAVLAANRPSHLALREGHWVYIGAQGGGGFGGRKVGDHALGGGAALKFAREINSDIVDGEIRKDAPQAQLYDLQSDLAQSQNVIEANPEIAQKMRRRLQSIRDGKGTRSGVVDARSTSASSAANSPKSESSEVQLLEGEALKVLKETGSVRPQKVRPQGGATWSGGAQIWWREGKPRDVIEFALPISTADSYRIEVGMTKARDYGIVEFALDGQKIAGPIDLYSPSVVHTGPIVLTDKTELSAGEHRLAVTLVGTNPKAEKKFMFGLDYVSLLPASESDVSVAGTPPANTKPAGEKFKEGNALAAPALSPDEQWERFALAEGFEIDLVASEESGLRKPVSLAFDDAGRLWTQTATEYPRDNNPAIWRTPGTDRVVVIDQPHLPGPHTVRTFAEGMVMPMGVLPYGNGAFVAQGPEILFLEDTDGDGKADQRKVMLQGFGVQDTHTLPHQLVRLPGGRIGFSQGVLNGGVIMDAAGQSYPFNKTLIASFKPDGTALRIVGTGMNNIWAWAQDRFGRVFIHEANDWGYSLTPFEEDSSYPSFVSSKMHPDAPMHPPTAEGLNLGGTGFSGIAICDDRSGYPDSWQGMFFIANPVLGKIHAVKGEQDAQGGWKFFSPGIFVGCDDPMFRPVATAFGPDGCLYIADWYNRIISHNEVARDHPARDKGHGRIWRVRATGQPEAPITDYTKVPTKELPAALQSDSTWAMRAAWHQMAQRQDKSVVPDLLAMLRNEQTPVDVRISALWTLQELGHFDASLWTTLLAHSSVDLRREAVRALTTLRVSQADASPVLKTLAHETAWTVRYEVLRYFRRVEGDVSAENFVWLREWSAPAAPTNKMKAEKGEFLALDGSYQRAFQDFLLEMAATKTQLPVMVESKWGGVIGKNPTLADPEAMAERIAEVKAALPSAKAEEGRVLTESICLTCHALGGKGVGFAPPLDGSASRDVEGLLTAIIDPNAAMENVFRTFRIVTKDGRTIEGFKQSETRRAITILLMGGVPQNIPIKEIKVAGYIDGQSVMPAITGSMTLEQVASIVAYLRSLK